MHKKVPIFVFYLLSSITPALTQAQTVTTVAPPPAGRLLASNCFQCHGTNGKSTSGFDSLAGESANEIYSELKEMQAKAAGNNIMAVHAKGYSDSQLRALASYLSKQ